MASSSIYSGVSGLQASQDMLDVVGNNLANINTTGYKSQSANFADLLYQTLAPATPSVPTALGGTDPEQVGFGVKVASITQNLSQGSLQTTGGQYDVALQGSGFFVVNNGSGDLFTRAGSFSVDANGYLVDASTGARVQRTGAVGEGSATSPAFQTAGNDGIQILLGQGIPGKQTANVTIQGNLSADAKGPLAQTVTSAQPFTAGGAAATATTPLNSLDDNTKAYVQGDVINITGQTVTGVAVNATFTVGATAPTMGDLISAINTNFPGSTASLDASGNLVVKANATGPASALSVSLTDASGNTGATNWFNHTFATTAVGTNGDTYNTAIQVYDLQGTAHTLTLTFQKTANNTWSLSGSIPAADGTLTQNVITGITFNQNGSFQQVAGAGPANEQMVMQINGMTSPQTINFNLGTPGGFAGLTQFGTPSAATAQSQDGYASGALSSVAISTTGLINGVFSNGQILPIAQMAIASFANANGLTREGSNYYAESASSGNPFISTGLSGANGTVQQGALESSNVDIAQEFTNMIIAQRSYQANARTITVSNEILQDLVGIIH